MARTTWPLKAEREDYEIRGFIHHYVRLPHRRRLEVVERREKPDFFLRDLATGEHLGVELTSVYLSDRSVPDQHIPPLRRRSQKYKPAMICGTPLGNRIRKVVRMVVIGKAHP
jgi:hypothetical protein